MKLVLINQIDEDFSKKYPSTGHSIRKRYKVTPQTGIVQIKTELGIGSSRRRNPLLRALNDYHPNDPGREQIF